MNKITESLNRMPTVEGPIPITESSYPFNDMLHSRVPLDVMKYGFVEEEYFIGGYANIYDVDDKQNVVIAKKDLPYKTRLLVRKPQNLSKFSGRVYFDIMNATQNYDIEDLWHRNYEWCMENGHAYVGITSKPVNVQSLKNFDYKRYGSLNWGSGEEVLHPAPLLGGSIPGTEEGLFWDMVGQTVTYIRTGNPGFFEGHTVEYVCFTGQSQSGCYLNTFIEYFDRYMVDGSGKHLLDGYLNIAGASLSRLIRQRDNGVFLSMKEKPELRTSIPFVVVCTETDLTLFKDFPCGDLPGNHNEDDNKCRYYEVAGSPHTDIDCPVLAGDSEILKCGRTPQPMDAHIRNTINPMPLAYYINGYLEKLYTWWKTGEAPEIVDPIKKNAQGEIIRDQHNNAVGGFRSPYVDVPDAEYIGWDTTDSSVDNIAGIVRRFSVDKMKALYGTKEAYIRQFTEYANRQCENGWLCQADVERMINKQKKVVVEF